MNRNLLIPALALSMVLPSAAVAYGARVMHFPMDVSGGSELSESVSGKTVKVYSVHSPENVDGAVGQALRLDGYSTYATGSVNAAAARDAVTFSLWVAPETYPIVKHDEPTSEKIVLAGTLDENAKKGWAFMLGSTGKYSFVCYSGGWKVEVEAPDNLPCYEWSHLMATANTSRIVLYRNGEEVKSGGGMGTIDDSSSTLFIGKSPAESKMNGFNLNTFNGLIDDLEVYDEVLAPEALTSLPQNIADLSIPAGRFAEDLLRPRLHGMPGANWTNETHGMTYSDGKYHVFFQKNANGPYMSRLHWGHISSPDLINWTEEKIALFPGASYDIKGCWSGCVFTDDVITGGEPSIIYTGVDYQKAYIAQATPVDATLLDWEKKANPIINGKPAGLSDDFRDPYFFRNGENAYIIVGSAKDGIGAVTLHKYIPLTGGWSNTAGDIFFAGKDKASAGTFWEMPNITRIGDKWLFTTTPQNTAQGVRTLYWTGSINSDGTFSPDAASASPRGVELISKDGFGLLSPTIYQHEGKTIAMGIVPDKLAGSVNYSLGWAHCYSLPREWSLDAQGNLLQKPFEGLRAARGEVSVSEKDFTLDGTLDLTPVGGRQIEALGRFTVGASPFGFNFFKSGSSQATVKYLPSANMLVVDLTKLDRTPNDNGSYNGMYSCVLPESIPAGSELTINLFVDGSILDIFVNDKWATSIRAFPAGVNADGIEAFADGPTKVNSIDAWVLDFDSEGFNSVDSIFTDSFESPYVDVVDIQGRLIRRAVHRESATIGLPSGIYIVGSRKILIP